LSKKDEMHVKQGTDTVICFPYVIMHVLYFHVSKKVSQVSKERNNVMSPKREWCHPPLQSNELSIVYFLPLCGLLVNVINV